MSSAAPPRAKPSVPRRLVRASTGAVVVDHVEVAASFWARFRGLMGRRELRRDAGLWLVDTKSIHMFFMRFSIDALFLGPADSTTGARRIVCVREGLKPWRSVVWWVRRAEGCLELPAGTAGSVGVREGDEVLFYPAV